MGALRHLHIKDDDKGNALLKQVFAEETNPIIIINGIGEPEVYNNITEKLEAIQGINPEEIGIMFVWEGKKKTDVFELLQDDIDRIVLLFDND